MSKPLLSCGPHIEKPWKDSLGHRTVTGNLLGSAFRIEVNISHTRFEAELSGLSENTTPASLAKTLGVVRVVVVVLVLVLVVAAGRVVTIGALPTRTADGPGGADGELALAVEATLEGDAADEIVTEPELRRIATPRPSKYERRQKARTRMMAPKNPRAMVNYSSNRSIVLHRPVSRSDELLRVDQRGA